MVFTTPKGNMIEQKCYKKDVERTLRRAVRENDPALAKSAADRSVLKYDFLIDNALAQIALNTNNVETALMIDNVGQRNLALQKIALKHKNLDAVRSMTSTDWQRPTVAKLKELLERSRGNAVNQMTTA